MRSNDELIGLHRAEFARADQLQYRILYVQIAITILAGFAVYLPEGTAAYFLAILTGIAAVVRLTETSSVKRRASTRGTGLLMS
jgi:hypothetical protein